MISLSSNQPLIGGLLIGLAALMLLALLGRILGVSGIIWNAVRHPRDSAWRWWFVGGIVTGAALLHGATGLPAPAPNPAGWPWVVVAGLLVGFGTRLGSGCTSGHGVCGIARLSPRSIVATLVFMALGVLTVTLVRHGFGGLA
ncbi:YeeE/YedE family protein [Halomonas denitrificans]|nr:YeeE/YedE family protein [Halomonas denitrificans]